MTKNEQVLKLVRDWAERIGAHEATKRLVMRDLGATTAAKMVSGKYTSTPTAITARILIDEMAKDGVGLGGEAS